MPVPALGVAAAGAAKAGMFSKLVGTLAPTIGGIAGDLFGNNRDRKLWREQQQWNLDQWNRQNAYNHPKAQMERLKEAGLNPRLVYQQGGAGATGQAGSVSPVNPPKSRTSNYGQTALEGILAYQNIEQNKLIHSVTEAQAKKELALTDVAYAQARDYNASAMLKEADAPYRSDLAMYTKDFKFEEARAKRAAATLAENDVKWWSFDKRRSIMDWFQKNEMQDLDMQFKLHQNQIKKWEAELSKSGLTPSDEYWYRQHGEKISFYVDQIMK